MYNKDLALDNQQRLICLKTKPSQKKLVLELFEVRSTSSLTLLPIDRLWNNETNSIKLWFKLGTYRGVMLGS